MSGIELIAQERKEQIGKHGRTIEQDKKLNKHYQLTDAASILIVPEEIMRNVGDVLARNTPRDWDYEIFKKMCRKSYKDRLIIAGALIAAEIDRISE